MASVSVERISFSDHEAAVTTALTEYHNWVGARFQEWLAAHATENDFSLTTYAEGELEKDLAYLSRADTPQLLVVALDEDAVVGCVYVYDLGADHGEVKRLYVREGYRGLGLGKHLMETLIACARDDGYTRLRLDTAPFMADALSLYRDLGFEPSEGHTSISAIPEPLLDEITYMQLSLADN